MMVRGFASWRSGADWGISVLLLSGMVLGFSGCAGEPAKPKPVPVKGTVIFRGKPLANARVTFYGPGAPMPAIGDTNDAGEFELSMYGKNDGAVVGENTVTVVLLSGGDGGAMPPDPTKIAAGGGNMPLSAEIGNTKTEGGVSLPAVYGDPKNSGLKVTVRPGGEPDVKLELK